SDAEHSDAPRARPAVALAVDQAPDDPEQAGARQSEPGEVELSGRPVGLAEEPHCERQQHDPDRDVQPEDPLPGDPVDDGAADERPGGYGGAGDPRPDAEGRARPPLREGTLPE